jgi:hypothetical protein
MKIMYPAKLGPQTKCPKCLTGIISTGGALYVCQNGHVVECVVMVTMKASDVTQRAVPEAPSVPSPRVQTNVHSDEPILPPKADKLQ